VIAMTEPFQQRFSLHYIDCFTKGLPLSATVILRLHPDVPMMIEYPIGENGHVKYFMSPRMENEENTVNR
jgi:proliferating cell nuclear antigen